MAAPIDAFVAGQYYTFYAQRNLDVLNFPRYIATTGTVVLDSGPGTVPSWVGASRTGFTLSTSAAAELVEGDVLGGSVIDTIYRGGNVFLSWDAISFRPGSILPSWPWAMLGAIGTVGRLGSAVGGTLFMAAAPLTPAVGNPTVGQVIINALTARNAILAENFRADWLFDTRLRRVPIQMRLLPFLLGIYTVGSYGRYSGMTIGTDSPVASVGLTNQTSNLPGVGGGINSSGGTASAIATTGIYGTVGDSAALFSNLGAGAQWANSATGWGNTATNPAIASIDGGVTNYSGFPYFAWYSLI